jgi:hypothetical protein
MPIPLIAQVIFGVQYSYDTHKLDTFLRPPATSFHLAPDIPLKRFKRVLWSVNKDTKDV